MSNAKQNPSRPVVKKGTDPVVRLLFWLLVILGAAALLEFKGPYKGWLTKLAKQQQQAPAEPVVADEPAPLEPEPVTQEPAEPIDLAGNTDDLPEEPPKSEMELLYDKLYGKYLDQYKPPQAGAAIKLKLRSGDTVTGVLEEVSPGRIKVRMKFGTMTYALHVVHPSMYRYLFPERYAKMKALAELENILAKRRAEEEATVTAEADARRRQQQEYERQQRAAAAEAEARRKAALAVKEPATATPQPAIAASGSSFHYDPSDAVTPEHLQRTLQAFGMRLRYQQRAIGAPIAKKIYAKQQADKVVLYMEMSRTFQAQDYDVRFAIADQLWNIWSMRCRETGKVRGANGAHLVMIDASGKQIGGSTEKSAADIWVKQGRG